VYQTDYDLGDYVTIEAYGQSSDHQITEVKESWAPLQYNIDCVFDKEPASLPAQVNTAVKSLQASFTQTEGYIVESGSNANGYYAKYSNGMMMQYGISTVTGYPYTLTFPVSFINTTYSITGIWNKSSAAGRTVTINTKSTSSTSIFVYNASGLTPETSGSIDWIAIGTWR
jgi:hypothetical protein